MKFIPKLIPSRENKKNFVVLEIGLGRVNIAIFEPSEEKKQQTKSEDNLENSEMGAKLVGVGRRSFGSADSLLDATLEATDALGAIVDELPTEAVVGVCGGRLEGITTIAKYSRENPKAAIDSQELSSVLKKVAAVEKKDKKVFFSTITSAKIDQAKVSNPVGIKGGKAEISCFVAYKPPEELSLYDQVIEELELKPRKIMPSSFAIAEMLGSKKEDRETLILRIGSDKTEAAQVSDGHLINISNFDAGFEQLEFFNFALEAVLEKQQEKERSKTLWLYSDSDEVGLEEVKKVIKEVDWKEKLGLEKALEINTPATENNFGPADMGLLALSLQEKTKS
jgi:hypothetical protein